MLEHCVQRDDNDTVSREDQEGRETNLDDLYPKPPLRAHEHKRNLHLLPPQRTEDKDTGCCLGDHRRHGGACNVHMKKEDEHRIQHNVDDCADQRRHHPQEREALRCDEVVHSHGEQRKDRPRSVDRHIGIRVGERHLARPEPAQKIFFCQKEKYGQYDRDDQHQRKTVSQDPPGALLVPGSKPDRKQDRAANPEQRTEGRQERDNGSAHSHSCKSVRSCNRNIPHIDPVHDTVEHVHKLCEHKRN